MKKIIILLLAILMSACSAVNPSETLSSMQTGSTAETTVTGTAATEETTEPIPKKTEPLIETQKTETIAPSAVEHPKQKPELETTTVTTVEALVEPINTETATTDNAGNARRNGQRGNADRDTGSCRNAA